MHFVARTDLASMIHEHICAFDFFSGAAASVEYEKAAVMDECRRDAKPTFNSTFLRFATHYGFRPTGCRHPPADDAPLIQQIQLEVLRGNRFRSLDHANDTLLCWLSAEQREISGVGSHCNDRQQHEMSHLIPLPANPWRG